jgi:hypothetical protein
MGKCNWCGVEVERDKLFAHQWKNPREQMLDQRRKQGVAMLEAATPNMVQVAMMEFVIECAHYYHPK